MSKIAFESVWPWQIHGFGQKEVGLEGLGRGLNVVFAPNASGKSTLAKAIRLVLDPSGFDGDGQVQFDATWLGVGGEVLMDPRAAVARKKGYNSPFGTPVGGTHLYHFDLTQMIQAVEAADRDQFMRLLGGGEGLEPDKPIPQKRINDAIRSVRDRSEDMARLRQEALQVADTMARLPSLQEDVARARSAQGWAAAVETALDLRRLEAAAEGLRQEQGELEGQLPGIGRQTENAVERVETAVKALENAGPALDRAKRALAQVVEDGRRPHPALLADTDRAVLSEARDRVVGLLEEKRAVEGRIAEARTQRDAALARIRALGQEEDANVEALRQADLEAIGRLTAQVLEARRSSAEKAGYEQAARAVQPEGDATPEALEEARSFLVGWLRSEPKVTVGRQDSTTWLLVAGFGIILVVVGSFLAGSRALPFAVLAVVGLGIAAYALWQLGRPATVDVDDSGRSNLKDQLINAAVQPVQMDAGGVADALATVERKLGDLAAARQLTTLAESRAVPDLNLPEWVAATGLRMEDPLRLELIARNYQDWLRHVDELGRAEADLEVNARNLIEARRRIQSVFARYGFPAFDAGEPETATKPFLDWFARLEEVEEAEKRLGDLRKNLEAALDAAGVPAAGLEERLDELGEREPAARTYQGLAQDLRDRESAIRSKQVDEPKLLAAARIDDPQAEVPEDPAGLETLLERVTAVADRHEEAQSQLNEATLKVHSFDRARTMLDAESALNEAESKLRAVHDDLLANLIQGLVATRLQERMSQDSPPMLERANQHLARFTQDRYKLMRSPQGQGAADKGLGRILVRDYERNLDQRFESLNTAAKVQTVMALRLATIDHHENEAQQEVVRFPLVADEILGAADPEASRAMARALAIASKERQVIVFTNQPDDAAILRAAAEAEGAPCKLLSIAGKEYGLPDAEPAVLDLGPASPGPASLDLYTPIGRHRACALGWSDPAEAVNVEAAATDETRKAMLLLLEASRRQLVAKRPRVDPSAMKAQPWCTGSFRDRLVESLEDARGDGAAFYRKAVTLARWRGDNSPAVEAFLSDGGHLEPITEEDVAQAVRKHLPDGAPPLMELEAKALLSAFVRDPGLLDS